MSLSPSAAKILADMVLFLHFGIVCFVIIGFIVLIPWKTRFSKCRKSPVFRNVHLALLVAVAIQAFLGRLCPITRLEDELRRAAGEAGYKRGLIADFINDLLYYDLPPMAFVAAYTVAAIAALLLYIYFPPERGKRDGE